MIAFPPPPTRDGPIDEKTGTWKDSWLKWFGLVAREFQTDDTAPDVPTGLALLTGLENVSQTVTAYITATWTDSTATDHDFYVVKLIRGSETIGEESTSIANSYKFAPLVPGQSYSVQVKDIDDSGNESAYCTAVTVASAGDTTAPAVPTGLAAAAAGVKQIRVTWTANTEADLAGYDLHASTTTGFTPSDSTRIAFVSDATAYTYDTPAYALYYFKIRSKDTSQNYSAYATQVSATSVQVVTGDITDANITTAKIADANITTAKIADANITTAKIGNAAITTAKIDNLAVTTATIADLNVTSLKINGEAVTTAKRQLVNTLTTSNTTAANSNNLHTFTHNLGIRPCTTALTDNTNLAVWSAIPSSTQVTICIYNTTGSSITTTIGIDYW